MGGWVPLQIVSSEDVLDPVGRAGSHLAGVTSQKGDSLILSVDLRRQHGLSDAANGSADSQPMLVDPVASIISTGNSFDKFGEQGAENLTFSAETEIRLGHS